MSESFNVPAILVTIQAHREMSNVHAMLETDQERMTQNMFELINVLQLKNIWSCSGKLLSSESTWRKSCLRRSTCRRHFDPPTALSLDRGRSAAPLSASRRTLDIAKETCERRAARGSITEDVPETTQLNVKRFNVPATLVATQFE